MNDTEIAVVEVLEGVRVVEPREDLADDAQVHVAREERRLPTEETRERHPVEVVHHDVVTLVLLTDLIGLDDVRMAQTRGEASLFEEHLEEGLVLDELRLQLLDYEELAEPRRTLRDGEINDAHAATGDLGDELILP
jgi:hypothetical protein